MVKKIVETAIAMKDVYDALLELTRVLHANTEVQVKLLDRLLCENSSAPELLDKALKKPVKSTKKTKKERQENGTKQNAQSLTKSNTKNIRAAFTELLVLAGTKQEKTILIGLIRPIIDHYGAERITTIHKRAHPVLLEFLQRLNKAYREGGIQFAQKMKFSDVLRDFSRKKVKNAEIDTKENFASDGLLM